MKVKISEYILALMVIAVAAYSLWVNISQDQYMKRNATILEDTRQLLFGSFDDVDTLVLEDRYIIFERGYDSYEKIIEASIDNKTKILQWNIDSETVYEMGNSTINTEGK